MQPEKYARQTDFSEQSGDETDHVALNQELDAIAQTADGLRENLALLQQDDGELKAGIVTTDKLAPDIVRGLTDEAASNVIAVAETVTVNARNASRAAASAALSEKKSTLNAQSASASALAARESSTYAISTAEAAKTVAEAIDEKALTALSQAGEAVSLVSAAITAANKTLLDATTALDAANAAVRKSGATKQQLDIATGPAKNAFGNRTVSAEAPSGGDDGDIWYQVAS